MKTKVLVFGGSGYSGLELLRILAGHPEIQLLGASSNRWSNAPLSRHCPTWSGEDTFVSHDQLFERVEPGSLAFLATHATVSHDLAPKILEQSAQVIDVSGAFRLATLDDVSRWYGFEHQHEALLKNAVYGLPELYADDYLNTQVPLIANPGCYPTACILSIAPLFAYQLVRTDLPVHVDGKSGVTGAGRKLADNLLFNEVAETFRPYRMTKHQHTPEMERFLTKSAKADISVSFTPHLIPVRRGLLTSSYLQAKEGLTQTQVDEAYNEFYKNQPFVRVLTDESPHPAAVVQTNFCDVTCKVDPRNGTVSAFGAIDNLVKGAAGQAIQNMNLLRGYSETLGLLS